MGFEVAALGELLIDMVPLPAASGTLNFAAKPGGAPGNAAVGLGKLGRSVCMLSKVGDDAFGRLLTRTIAASGASIDHIIVTKQHRTGVAVVTLDEQGDRDFLFYRQDCADANYTPAEVADDVITQARMLHVNSLVLSAPASASAERHAIAVAQAAGILISVDPNLRPLLWDSTEAMVAAAREVIAVANVLKVGADELAIITGIADPIEALESLWHDGLRVAAITCAAKGAIIVTPADRVTIPGVPVKVVDTTGCGDSFMAAFLAGLLESAFDLSAENLARIGGFACAAGAMVATVPGGMDAMPTRAEVETFMAERGL
ncbi:carbohydrate kinase [Acidisoma cellulosilytica]|uniref:Carbohydrate kinase n=1 Tax=Acidisoma cellulosilyticum TaxID=2802395 RepID=A0A964E1U1_9PROT|nr:carbohydrate kinase [Acidisoma cellulosilyticum]MCB8878716.1 carbohydrate kinase [Acidisoma cellulosilyticum]